MLRVRTILAAVLLFNVISLEANDSSRQKWGFEYQALRTTRDKNVGWLVGGRWAWFIGTSNAFLGLRAHFGSPLGNNPVDENILFAGFQVGYDGKFSRSGIGVYELSFTVGYGRGKIAGISETSYYVVEPSIAAGFALGLGWRILFTSSYINLAHTNLLSGVTLGIRFDKRYDTKTRAIDP